MEFEKVPVWATLGRARPIVANLAEIVLPLARTIWQVVILRDTLPYLTRVARKIVEHPMDPCASRRSRKFSPIAAFVLRRFPCNPRESDKAVM